MNSIIILSFEDPCNEESTSFSFHPIEPKTDTLIPLVHESRWIIADRQTLFKHRAQFGYAVIIRTYNEINEKNTF